MKPRELSFKEVMKDKKLEETKVIGFQRGYEGQKAE
jgi:hypothetical protein